MKPYTPLPWNRLPMTGECQMAPEDLAYVMHRVSAPEPDNVALLARCFAFTLEVWLAQNSGFLAARTILVPAIDCANKHETTNACHSHDYMDANMTMAQAWRMAFGAQHDLEDPEQRKLWNAAWEEAITKKFSKLCQFIETDPTEDQDS